MKKEKPIILLTNDDGISSLGLWAAAETLFSLGEVRVIAPRDQSTSAGRSNPISSDGIIQKSSRVIHGKEITGYSVGASPAQCVIYAMQEILPCKPDLLVSGINYGANTGIDITRSGTIGAALEAANYGIRALAVSLETDAGNTFIHTHDPDFSTAAYFTAYFASAMLKISNMKDVDVLKVEIPADATPLSPWEITRLTPVSLYLPKINKRNSWNEKGNLNWEMQTDYSTFPEGTDSHSVFVRKHVAVTPLSMDLTSHIDLNEFGKYLEKSLTG
jgi:5'-nucleotidase